jgi:hypothetical protein
MDGDLPVLAATVTCPTSGKDNCITRGSIKLYSVFPKDFWKQTQGLQYDHNREKGYRRVLNVTICWAA